MDIFEPVLENRYRVRSETLGFKQPVKLCICLIELSSSCICIYIIYTYIYTYMYIQYIYIQAKYTHVCNPRHQNILQKELSVSRRTATRSQRKSMIVQTSPTMPRCHSPSTTVSPLGKQFFLVLSLVSNQSTGLTTFELADNHLIQKLSAPFKMIILISAMVKKFIYRLNRI